jgi:hypothetical protein
MNKSLLLLVFFFSFQQVRSQLTFTQDAVDVTFNDTISDYKYDFYTNNTADYNYDLYWEIIKQPSWPTQWELYVCDLNLCYLKNVIKSSNNFANVIEPGIDTFMFHVLPNNFKATGSVTFVLRSESNSGPAVLSLDMTFSNQSSDTENPFLVDVTAHPNPVVDYLRLSNDDAISHINIVDIMGKIWYNKQHLSGESHDLQDLPTGIYFAQCYGQNQSQFRTFKLSKL